MDVERYVQRCQRFPQWRHPLVVEVEQIVLGVDLTVSVHHDPFEPELGDAAFKFACRFAGIMERQTGHADISVRVRAHSFGEKLVDSASGALRLGPVGDRLYAKRRESY